MKEILRITIKEFPPSVNRLYFSLPGGGKAMTKEGHRFQHLVIDQIQREHGAELAKFNKNQAYAIEALVFFPGILNKGWPGSAQQKYKKRDATNLIKLLEDTLAKAIGVDDANFLRFEIEKQADPANPRIVIMISEYGES